MYKSSIAILMLLFIVACNKGGEGPNDDSVVVESECMVDEAVETNFLSSAKVLYTRRVRASEGHTEYNADTLSTSGAWSILEKLGAIVKAAETNDRIAEIINDYGVRAHIGWSTNELMFYFNESSVYTTYKDNWGTTGNTVMDRMANDYNYVITTAYDDYSSFLVSGDYELNMEAIIEGASAELGSEGSVEVNHVLGLSRNITLVSTEEKDMFTFSYGWGDCPSGCIHKHYWSVSVDQDCVVRLEDEWGDDLTE